MKREVRRGVRDIIQRVGLTSIFVTHDRDEAFDIADKIVVFNRYALSHILVLQAPFLCLRALFIWNQLFVIQRKCFIATC